MVLRLTALWLAAPHGLTWSITAIVCAQFVSTASIGVVGLKAFRRFPQVEAEPLGSDRKAIVSFVAQSSVGTGVISVRNFLAPLLLGIVTTPVQVGYFNVAKSPQSGFLALSAPARMVLLTEQTRDWEHGRRSAVLHGVRRYTMLAALLMIVVVPPLYYFMPRLVELVYSSEYAGAGDAARVFLLAAAVQFLVGVDEVVPGRGRPSAPPHHDARRRVARRHPADRRARARVGGDRRSARRPRRLLCVRRHVGGDRRAHRRHRCRAGRSVT